MSTPQETGAGKHRAAGQDTAAAGNGRGGTPLVKLINAGKRYGAVIALHDRDGNANTVIDLGVEDGLAQLVKAGRPPFAVVGVDGGEPERRERPQGRRLAGAGHAGDEDPPHVR